MATDAWGVDDGYWDTSGEWHTPSAKIVADLRAAMDAPDDPPPEAPLWVVQARSHAPLMGPCELALEDGSQTRVDGELPPDLPIGYHELRPFGGQPTTRLIVTPGRCHLPQDLREWALAVQLYACRSEHSWGIGDLGDLWRIGVWALARGAGLVGLNPLHAPLPLERVEPSPYFPSSRRWRNPLYLRIEEIPGASDDAEVAAFAAEARALSAGRLIDRDSVWRLKQAALERLWGRLGPDLRLERWREEQGETLETYVRFCALAEQHGCGWSSWPQEHRHPSSGGVARFAAERQDRLAFWAWVQLLIEEQLARCNEAMPLLHDLAIGVDPDGAEAWAYQDLLALDVRVGAPPDDFNPAGQDWGLPPFVPWKLRAAGYQPLAELWRSGLALGGGLRIDHVMGLFRLFWLLPGRGPADGAYVRYRSDELLAVLAIESVRSGSLVVGEDLGTVEESVRQMLTDAGVLSTRLVWFEDEPPSSFPSQALAAVTTHDLPTVAGVWSGEDGDADLRDRLAHVARVGPDAAVEDVIVGVHRELAAGPSALASVAMEDALAVSQRPNLPGTTTERPNWSLALPARLDEALEDPLVNDVAAAMRQGGRPG